MVERVIAIDGPSGVGKSSVSKKLAGQMAWTYLDTGAMYRAVTLAWIRADQKPDLLKDEAWLHGLDLDYAMGKMMLQGEWVSDEIRTPQVTALVSEVAAEPTVRQALTALQRIIAKRRPCILDGRDIGTVVFPNAFIKVFLTASPEVRAKRRWLQLGGDAGDRSLEEILADQLRRDKFDSERETAPLVQADDAWVVQTDEMTKDEVVGHILTEVNARLAALEA